jgi:hypothetical protein
MCVRVRESVYACVWGGGGACMKPCVFKCDFVLFQLNVLPYHVQYSVGRRICVILASCVTAAVLIVMYC